MSRRDGTPVQGGSYVVKDGGKPVPTRKKGGRPKTMATRPPASKAPSTHADTSSAKDSGGEA